MNDYRLKQFPFAPHKQNGAPYDMTELDSMEAVYKVALNQASIAFFTGRVTLSAFAEFCADLAKS